MPNPSASSPDLPALHAHTHRPKAQGGTDPIEVGTDLKWASGGGSTNFVAVPATGSWFQTDFDFVYSNDPSIYGVDAGNDYLTISQPGYYVAKFGFYRGSVGDWPNTEDTRIYPIVDFGGSPASLQDNLGAADWIGDYYNPRSQYKTGDETDLSLVNELTFNWNPDNPVSDLDYENPLKITCVMLSGDPTPPNTAFGFQVFVMRIASAGYTTIL